MPAVALADHNENNEDPCEEAPVSDFADRDEARATHRPSIDCAVYRAITVGAGTNADGEEIYLPLREVTRGQMASFIYNALVAGGYEDQFTSDGTGDDAFSDISGNTHKRSINILAAEDIVRGFSDGRYRPGLSINRQQMASFIVQAARWAVGDDHPITRDAADRFTDVPANNVHKDNIEAGADAGLFLGVTNTQFKPGVNVLRDQMATFLVNLLRFIFNPNTAPGPQAGVTFSDASAQPGQPITGTIRNARSASVSGACVQDGAVTDISDEEGIQFSITTNPNAEPGSCELTFTIVNEDGETITRTVTVTIEQRPAGAGVTVRPELVRAEVVSTTTQDQATGSNPAGTVVRYVFDEPITGNLGTNNLFHVYDADGTQRNADSVVRDPNSTSSVLARYNFADTASEANLLSVATVDFGAVEDPDNNDNPIGDAPLGANRSVTTNRQAGKTEAPDLETVDNFRAGASSGTTAVDFTFDEQAFVTAFGDDAGSFFLVTTDNTLVPCQAPATGSTTPGSGTTSPGGNGTTKITVTCTNPNNNPLTNPGGDPLNSTTVARGGVQEGSVADASGNDNPLQIDEVVTDGATNGPDLLSVEFRPSADTTADIVIYTFDEAVNVPANGTANRFKVYLDSGDEVLGGTGTASDNPNRDANNTARVSVEFPDGTLTRAVGASVEQNAVTAVSDGDNNEADELPQNPTQTTTEVTAGRTDGPDLVSVTLTEQKNEFGTTTGVLAVYTFDEALNLVNGTNKFFLVRANGARITCTNAVEGTNAQGADTVRCTTYQDANGGNLTGTSGAATVFSAVLGTVDDGAVDDEAAGQNLNPEGAAPTTGGSGTPQS